MMIVRLLLLLCACAVHHLEALCPTSTEPLQITVGTVEDAVDLATLLLCPGTYYVTWVAHIILDSTLMIGPGTTLIIIGMEDGIKTPTIDGGEQLQMFNITGPRSDLVLESLTLIGGYSDSSGGAIVATNAAVSISKCNVTNNAARVKGGAVYIDVYSSLVATDSIFSHNSAAWGGAIESDDAYSKVTLQNSEFSQNLAFGLFLSGEPILVPGLGYLTYIAWGGAINVFQGELIATDCVFIGNTVQASPDVADKDKLDVNFVMGGAVICVECLFQSCNFTGNSATASEVMDSKTTFLDGGGVKSIDQLILINCTFTDNFVAGANAQGGGLNAAGPISIENSTFTGNGAYSSFDSAFGGGAVCFNDNIYITNSIFTENHASYANNSLSEFDLGGAVYASPTAATCIIISSNFTKCTASKGGGMYLNSNSTVLNSNFWENTNALFVSSDTERLSMQTLSVENCIFEENTSLGTFYGGAILILANVYATSAVNSPVFLASILDTSFINNVAAAGGAVHVSGISGCNTDVYVGNCTFIGNQGGAGGGFFVTTTNMVIDSPLNPVPTLVLPTNVGPGLTVLLNTSTFISNEAGTYGGAVYAQDSGNCVNMTVTGCSFVSNTAVQSGGAVYMFGGISFNNVNFISNSAATGGALHGGLSAQNLEFRNCMLVNNTATGSLPQAVQTFVGDGGAVVWAETEVQQPAPSLLRLSYNVTTHNTTFTGNTCARYGGAIKAHNVYAYDTVFDGNRGLQGGAVWANELLLDGSTFNSNTANTGGAAYVDIIFGTGSRGAQFTNNEADASGGAVYVGTGIQYKYIDGVGVLLSFSGNRAGCCYYASTKSTYEYSSNLNMSTFMCEDIDGPQDARDTCCTRGQYVEQLDCVLCTEGFDCSTAGLQLGDIPVLPGYWRASLESTVGRRCLYPNACDGGTAGLEVNEYCAQGYDGPYCAVCASGYAHTTGKMCAACSDKYMGVSIAIFIILIIVVVVVLWLLGTRLLDVDTLTGSVSEKQGVLATAVMCIKSVPFAKFRVPIVVFQILTQYVAVTGARFPDVYESFLAKLSIISLDMTWLLSTGCLFNLDFYERLVVATLAPLVVIGLLGCSLLRIHLRKDRPMPVSSFSHAFGADEFREYAFKVAVDRHVFTFMVFTFLIYSTVSTIAFQTFACDYLEEVKERYLRAEYSISCDTSKHDAYKVYAGIMIVIFPVGIPCLYAYMMFKQRRGIHAFYADSGSSMDEDTHAHLKSTSFLWQSYRESWYFWELFECVRRLCLTGFMVFIRPGTSQQLAVACAFAAIVVIVYALCSPHRSKSDGYIYILGCATVFLSTYLGLLLFVDVTDNGTQNGVGLSWLLITMNMTLLVVAIIQCAVFYKAARKQLTLRRSISGMGSSSNLQFSSIRQSIRILSGRLAAQEAPII